MVSGSPDVSTSFASPYSNSFVSQSGWWCPALRMSPIHLSPLIAIHLSPNLAGGVGLSACLQLICLPLKQFIFLLVWLVVSGSPDVSNSFVPPYSNSFVSQSGWWCPALRMSPIHLSPLIAIHLSPSLAGGVRLSGCFRSCCQGFPVASIASRLAVWFSTRLPDVVSQLSPRCLPDVVS